MNSFSIESIAQKKMWRGFALIAEKQLNSILISLFGRATICIIFSLQAFLLFFFSLSSSSLFCNTRLCNVESKRMERKCKSQRLTLRDREAKNKRKIALCVLVVKNIYKCAAN